MARGSKIIVSSEPRGRVQGCLISGTPSPGTIMELVPSTIDVNGLFTFRAASRVDGGKGGNPILLDDELQGKLATDAYISGTYGRIYWPIAGEEFNCLFRDQPGTGTVNAAQIGDKLEVDGATGMLQAVGTGGATGSHASSPFQLLEHPGVDNTTNVLYHVQYLGDNA